MNAAERVRAYLDARYQDYVLPDTKGVIAYVPPSITGTAQELREADLEALLQTLEILAQVIASNQGGPATRWDVLRLAAEQVEQ